MKKTLLLAAFLVLSLVLSTAAFAQDNSNSGNNQAQQNSQTSQSSGGQHMSGKVSKNGKTFTDSSSNKSYNVSNPDALAGHEGQPVGLIVHVDPDNNVIHIIQVEAPPQ
jgi:type II secretory pathway pseudopilin PulG